MSLSQNKTIIATFDEAMRLVTIALKIERRLPHDALQSFFNTYPKVLNSVHANSNAALIPSVASNNIGRSMNSSTDCYKQLLQKSIALLCQCMMDFQAEMTELIQKVSMMGMVTLQSTAGFPLRDVAGEDSGTAKPTIPHSKQMTLVDCFKVAMTHVLNAFVRERRMPHHLLYAFYDVYPKIIMHRNATTDVLITHHPDNEFRDSRWSHDIIELQRSLCILCDSVSLCPEEVAGLIPLVSHAMISFEIPGFPLQRVDGEASVEHHCTTEANVRNETVHAAKPKTSVGVAKFAVSGAKLKPLQYNASKTSAITPSTRLVAKPFVDPFYRPGTANEMYSSLSSKKIASPESKTDDFPLISVNDSLSINDSKSIHCTDTGEKSSMDSLVPGDGNKRKRSSSPGNDNSSEWDMRRIPKKPTYGKKEIRRRMEAYQKMISYHPSSVGCTVEPKDTALCVLVKSTSHEFYRSKEVLLSDEPDLLEFCEIDTVVLIYRPATTELLYRIADLHKYLHGTLHIGSQQDAWLQEAFDHCKLIVIQEDDKNYHNDRLGIYVQYGESSHMVSSLCDCFPKIAPIIDSSCDSARKVPFVSCGYSTSDTNKYASNRTNVLGSTKPALIEKGIPEIEPTARVAVVQLVCQMVKSCEIFRQEKNNLFFHSDPAFRSIRKELATEFWKQLVQDSKEISPMIMDYFRGEGVAFIYNNFVSFHTDRLNDPAKCMNDTISFSMSFNITEEMACFKGIKKAMSQFSLQVGQRLSVLVAVYARKCVADFCKKQIQVKSVLDKTIKNLNAPLWLLNPVVTVLTQVNVSSNSNTLWDNPSKTINEWSSCKTKHENDQYRGEYIKVMGGLEKTQYLSPVKYLADLLHARGVISWTGKSLMEYIIFASFFTNGTFLLSGIIDDAMTAHDPQYSRFANEVKAHGVLPALLFESHRRMGPNGSCGESLYPRCELRKSSILELLNSVSNLDNKEREEVKTKCHTMAYDVLEYLKEVWNNFSDRLLRRKKLDDAVEETGDALIVHLTFRFKNAKHCHVMTFMHLCSMFGYLPPQLCLWGTIWDTTSDAYKAIDYFHSLNSPERERPLLLREANSYMRQVTQWVSKNMNYNFTLRYAEHFMSRLCPTDKCEKGGDGAVYDILYYYRHRAGALNHIYRSKMDSSNTYQVQMLPIGGDNQHVSGSQTVILQMSPGKHVCGGTDNLHAYMLSPFEYRQIQVITKYSMSDEMKGLFGVGL